MMKGAENILNKHPEIKLVANQAGDWDATKARAVVATVIQQNPDLCAVVGFWDVMDLGAAAAIKESGKPIALVTSGGGEQMACDNVEKGVFAEEIAYPVLQQGQDLTDMVAMVLQNGQPAGKQKVVIYTPTVRITKDTLRPGLCWSAKALRKS
jgi:ribose transport system substrate-binding protein